MARTRGVARICRTQRDTADGQLEVEEVGAHSQIVIAGLDPAIHPLRWMDTRVKPGYDDFISSRVVERHAGLDDLVGIGHLAAA